MFDAVTVVCIYRPPGVSLISFAKQRFIVFGDFSCPGVDERQLDATLDDLLQSYDVTQHVVEDTRRQRPQPVVDICQ